jgi:hypothetical protein
MTLLSCDAVYSRRKGPAFGRYSLRFQGWRQYISSKLWFLPTSLHGITIEHLDAWALLPVRIITQANTVLTDQILIAGSKPAVCKRSSTSHNDCRDILRAWPPPKPFLTEDLCLWDVDNARNPPRPESWKRWMLSFSLCTYRSSVSLKYASRVLRPGSVLIRHVCWLEQSCLQWMALWNARIRAKVNVSFINTSPRCVWLTHYHNGNMHVYCAHRWHLCVEKRICISIKRYRRKK